MIFRKVWFNDNNNRYYKMDICLIIAEDILTAATNLIINIVNSAIS